jgi:hypothetical protein
MKTTTNIVTLIILTILWGCGQTASQDKSSIVKNDSIQTTGLEKEPTKEEKQRIIDEEIRIDSLRLDNALKNAFKIAHLAFKTENFTKQYEFHPDDSSYAIKIEVLIGRLFKDNQKYFLLRRHIPWATYLNLYKVNGDKAEELIEREQGGMTYIQDTIFDANGDGHKDYLVHWYPSSGCCRREVYNVYLNQPDKGNFTNDYEFINPTFSATEKIIRGVEYGHPGEVGLYKYKWNGLQVDTIEFIYPDANNKGQFIKTKKGAYRPTNKEGTVLKAVPKEYQKIESYEWFADF